MKSPLIFRVFKGEQIHVVKQFVDKDQILFGHEADVDIDLDSTEVSPIHCLIEKRGVQYFLCDLGSTQGTLKNGQPVLDEPIGSGDEFSVGPFRVIFFVGAPKPVHSPKTGSEVVIEPTPAASKPADPPQAVAATPPPPVKVTPQPSVTSAASEVVSVTSASTNIAAAVVEQTKPQIHSAVVGSRTSQKLQGYGRSKIRKGKQTFAPESQIKDLKEFIKPSKGQLVEVLVSWKERILTTYHFVPAGIKKLGRTNDIQIPDGCCPKNWSFLDFTNGITVRTTGEMKVEVQKDGEVRAITEQTYRMQQGEVVFVTLANEMQLVVRFAPVAPIVPFDSPLILSSTEFTGILAALIIAALTSLIVSVTVPKAVDKEEEVQRVAQVIFNKPPEVKKEIPPPPPPQQPPVVREEKPKPKPPEQIKKVTEAEKAKEAKAKGDPKKPDAKVQTAQTAGRANEVKPKDPKLKTKMFTSTKQGGAIKTGEKSGANAQSKEVDPTNSGLLAAFGSGGANSKLSKAYNGSGEAMGLGEKANGSSGFNENRAGDGLGSKFKDTGAGGKGTATQGIAGIGTKGRGTGMSEFGNGNGFGSKDQVAVEAGGADADFVGSIDREAVRRAVRSALAAFKSCYDREYKKDTKLEGKVVIAWEIHEKGVGKNARVVKEKSTISNTSVEECVRSRMLTLRFPEPPAGTIAEVTYPFMFQGQK